MTQRNKQRANHPKFHMYIESVAVKSTICFFEKAGYIEEQTVGEKNLYSSLVYHSKYRSVPRSSSNIMHIKEQCLVMHPSILSLRDTYLIAGIRSAGVDISTTSL